MIQRKLGTTGFEVSPVGIGGHYRAIEEGTYEERTAYISQEIPLRCRIVERAAALGITYFDTTWKNESTLLGHALKQTGLRDKVLVNGMVLGSFTGSTASGLSVEDYFAKWLNFRLSDFPGGYFDTFMINAIEEGYSDSECEKLVRYLEKRKTAGDIRAFGFSSHDPFLARKVADLFPQFQTVMLPYNYLNRRFEDAFEGYDGKAAFIAMKPLVWAEYGVPFCALNHLSDFHDLFGFEPDPNIATAAFRFTLANPRVTTVVSAVNSVEEVDKLAAAAHSPLSDEEDGRLAAYRTAQAEHRAIPLFLSAMQADNLRMNFFGVHHLSRLLGVDLPLLFPNEEGAREQLQSLGTMLRKIVSDRKLLPQRI